MQQNIWVSVPVKGSFVVNAGVAEAHGACSANRVCGAQWIVPIILHLLRCCFIHIPLFLLFSTVFLVFLPAALESEKSVLLGFVHHSLF